MTKKVFSLDTQPGIQRDGTDFDKNYHTDGRWVRFQRGRPRKIGGFRAITTETDGISRGIFVNSEDGTNTIYNGYNNGLQVLTIDNNGVGSGVNNVVFGGQILTLNTLVGGSSYTNGTYTNVTLTGGSGSGAKATVVVSGNAVTSVTITAGGVYYLVGNTLSAAASSIGGTGAGFSIKVATINNDFIQSDLNLWQFDAEFDVTGGTTLLLAHPGQILAQIDATTDTAVQALPVNSLISTPLRDINGPSPTGALVEVSGGVCVLHPYVFVYGNNGLIKNSAGGDPFDWNSPDANEVNVASNKIVKGLPVRGGSNSPSGLFWSLDSLIRVSLAPQTLGVPGTPNFAPTNYWRYDIITTQSSILSSQSVIEYDGIYYWCGVDRFLLYNGVVKEIPNQFNQNYFFDNLNYDQRQKVWATKVPRYGEIWWFYPSGTSEECNNAIIYNIREGCWYDAGFADGATRSAGYFSQVFRFPINSGTDLSTQEAIFTASITTVNLNANIQMAATNQIGYGQLVVATGIPSGTYVVAIAPSATPGNITVTLSAAATASATVTASFETMPNKTTLWQHEVGTDKIVGQGVLAIESFFTTSDLGWISGGPYNSPAPTQGGVGDNYWLHIERIEPDFVMSGEMYCQVIGRPYAQAESEFSAPFYFDDNTNKIDMREQRRELRLKFVSNVVGGTYQTGKILLNANVGDVRGY